MRLLADLQRAPDAEVSPTIAPTLPVTRARTFDTPEFAGMTFLEVETKSALNKVSGMPFGWSINPYRGCQHACSYCFARPTHEYLNLSPTADFDRTVVVKTNIAEVLRGELARPRWKGEHVAMGTNTDPYQRAEGRYRLMPDIIRALAQSWTPFSILTKGTMITRDLPVLLDAAQRVPVAVSLTIGTLDRPTWRTAEPGTPSPRARLDAVRALNDAGIPTGVMMAPIMPGINDDPEQLAAVATAAVAAGATHVTPIPLHLRPGVKAAFWPWLEATHPALVEAYTELYGPPEAGRKGRSTLPEATVETMLRIVRDARDAAWGERGTRPAEGSWPDRARPGEHVTGHAGSPSDTAADPPVPAEQLSII